jgi:hypothetical protein
VIAASRGRAVRWSVAVRTAARSAALPNSRVSGEAAEATLVWRPRYRAAVHPRWAVGHGRLSRWVNAGLSVVGGVGVLLRTPMPAPSCFRPRTRRRISRPAPRRVRVSLGAARTLTFVITLPPTAAFEPTVVELDFAPSDAGRVRAIPGVNTVWLSASSTWVADVVAASATVSRDGTLHAAARGPVATTRGPPSPTAPLRQEIGTRPREGGQSSASQKGIRCGLTGPSRRST